MTARRTNGARALLALLLALFALPSLAAEGRYPGKRWERLRGPEKIGWSRAKLEAARAYAGTIPTAAVMLIVDGQVLEEWGETQTRFNVHSIRKSFLSALYGIHVGEGRIDLSATMADLGIDDNEPSLTPGEKQATVGDLLKARSGVYHPALYETAGMRAARPPRGSHAPGTFWYYNNWDFNVLGTIFERRTKTNLFAEFKARLADPLGMQDFRLEDANYVTGADSVYPAWGYSCDRTKLRACSSPRRASTTRGPLEISGRGSAPMPTAWTTWTGCGGPRALSVPAAGILADGPPRMVATSARPAVAGPR